MEAGLTIDVVLLQPPLKLCSVEIWRLKRVMKINQFLNYFPIHWQFAWKSNFLNLKNKILTFIHWWEGSNTAPMLYLICCKQAYFFYVQNWNLDWDSLCQSRLARLLLNWVLITQTPLKGLHNIRLLFLTVIILKAFSQLFPIWTAKLQEW